MLWWLSWIHDVSESATVSGEEWSSCVAVAAVAAIVKLPGATQLAELFFLQWPLPTRPARSHILLSLSSSSSSSSPSSTFDDGWVSGVSRSSHAASPSTRPANSLFQDGIELSMYIAGPQSHRRIGIACICENKADNA
jgi:hypothetical protein